MNNDITIKTGNVIILDEIKELWEDLNQLHLDKSINFKQHYMNFSFQSRKDSLIHRTENGKLFIAIAYYKDMKIGYCISSVVDDTGEIDSIYIKPDYRRNHIGNMLMETSMNWIKSSTVKKIIIKVSVGNEEVFEFYSKYGFVPRLTELQYISEQ